MRRLLDSDAEGWTAFWSIHLGLCWRRPDGAGLAFAVDRDSLLDLASFPGSAEEFCGAMERRLAVRGAAHVGSFGASDGTIVHRWPGPRAANPAPQA